MRTIFIILVLIFAEAIALASQDSGATPGSNASNPNPGPSFSPTPNAALALPDVPGNLISDLEGGIFKYTNQYRTEMSLPLLTENTKDGEAARWFSQEMARTGHFNHIMADGTSFETRINSFALCDGPCPLSTENIYDLKFNFTSTSPDPRNSTLAPLLPNIQTEAQIDAIAKMMVTNWSQSPEHRRNLQDPLVKEIGVGVAVSSSGHIYATEDFFDRTPLTPDQHKILDASITQSDVDEKAYLAAAASAQSK